MMAFELRGFTRDVRYSVRTLTRHRTFSAIAILTIALAVGANAVAFALLRTVLDPLPYGHGKELVSLAETDAQTITPQTASYATARDWAAQATLVADIATFSDAAVRFVRTDGVEMVRGMRVSSNFFETLGVRMALGRSFRKEEGRDEDDVVVLTYETWVAVFDADASIIGRTVPAVGGAYTVIGVLPADFHPLHMSNPAELPRLFIPYDGWRDDCRTAACRRIGVIGRLKGDVSADGARSEMQRITESLVREYPDQYPSGESAVVVPLREHIVGRFESAALTVELAVVLLLALACANVTMLLLTRTLSRQAEFAVRIALGASRWQIARQLTMEGLVLALAGGAAGGSAAWWTTRVLAASGAANVPRIGELTPDASLLAFALAVSVLLATTAGLAPVLMLFRRSFAATRDAQGVTPRGPHRTMRLLVGVELALAFVLVAVVGLLSRSYLRLMDVNPGFDANGVLTLSLLPDARYPTQARRLAWFDAVVERMRAVPSVEDAGYASTLPLSHPYAYPLFIREQPTSAPAPVLDTYFVSSNYPRIMRIPLLAGRDFARSDGPLSEPVALVSESAARLYFGDGAIGAHVQVAAAREDGWARVVGIVGDVHQYGLDHAADPAVYLLFDQMKAPPQGWASLVVRSRVPAEHVESAARAAMRDVDPLEPVFHLQPMATYIALSLSQRTFALFLVGGIGALALVLATGGVYGVVSYIVELRTREVGLRLALGATAASVRRLIASQVLMVAAAAIACGVVLTALVGRAISSLLFGVGPLDPVVTGSVAALILLVAVAASAPPVWHASRVDPMVALKMD